jgi:hypothetical protein
MAEVYEEFHVDPQANGFGYVLRLYPYDPAPGEPPAVVTVKAARVESIGDEGPMFVRDGASRSSDTTANFDDAGHDVEGTIRFDGCANLDLSTDHFCLGHNGPGGFRDLAVTVERAYIEAQRMMRVQWSW